VEIQKGSEEKDMRRGIITAIYTVHRCLLSFGKRRKKTKKMGISIEHNRERDNVVYWKTNGKNITQNTQRNMVINVYKYGRGGRCV